MGNLISSSKNRVVIPQRAVTAQDLTLLIKQQETTITRINDIINKTDDMLVIDHNTTTTRPDTTTTPATPATPVTTTSTIPATATAARFANTGNVEHFINAAIPVSDYTDPPQYYPKSNIPITKDYINAYNDSIALIDDPNQLNKIKFDMFIHLQDKKISDLNDVIQTFPTNSNINRPPIKSIKNFKTSTALNVEEFPVPQPTNSNSTITYTGNGSTTYPNYLIYSNNGCLQYNKSIKDPITNNFGQATWGIDACNSNDARQRFTMTKIQTKDDYNNKLSDDNKKKYSITDSTSVKMGFNVVNPETAADQCLMFENGNAMSIMPCNMSASQRFKPFYHTIHQ